MRILNIMPNPTSTVRIPARTYDRLKTLARAEGKPMSVVLDEAVDRYEADLFFHDMDDADRALRADPGAWQQELAERALWDGTLMDGLDGE